MGTCFLYGNGGGTTGATLTVTAPAGVTVTAAKDGKSKTKAAGTDGVVIFKGLESGEWSLTISDGAHTATNNITITADYAITMAFFAATINVTYPAGSTCTATYGATTLTAPDTTGSWACIVPNAGTWTITATDGTDTATASVTITEDGQSESVTLTYRLPYFYYNGSKNVTLSGSSYSDSGGYITITSTDDGSGDRAPTVSFAIPEIQKYNTIKCTINSFGGSNPTIKIQNSSNVDIASVTVSSTKTYAIDISSKSLSGNGYKFVLGTSSHYEQTDEYGNGYWVAGTVKTNHIWGE